MVALNQFQASFVPPLGADGGAGPLGSMVRRSGVYLSTTKCPFTSLGTSASPPPTGRRSRAADGCRLTARRRRSTAQVTLVLFLLLGWAILSQAMTLRCAGMGTELSNGRDLGEQLEMVSRV